VRLDERLHGIRLRLWGAALEAVPIKDA